MAATGSEVVTLSQLKTWGDEKLGGGGSSLTLHITFGGNSRGMKVRYVGADAQVHDMTGTGSIEVKAGVPVALMKNTSTYYPAIREFTRGTYKAMRDFVPFHETNATPDAFGPLVDMTLTLVGSL